jgi:MFS family permease
MKITGRHLLVLIGMCGLLASGVGLVTNVSGLFFTPLMDDFGILRGQASLMPTICNIALAVGGMFVPRLLSEKTLKPLMIGATAVLAASTAALALCNSITPMYLLCVLRGLAAGCLTFVFATTVLNNWFIANIGLATSIAMGFSGIAGAVFSPVVNGVITSSGWRAGFILMAALTVALNLPAILFLPSLDPRTKGLLPLGAAEADVAAPAASDEEKQVPTAPINMILFGAIVAYALFGSALTAPPQHFPGLAETYALGAAVGATMLSASMISNTVGKIALGALIDRIGTKLSILAYVILNALAIVMMLVMRGSSTMIIAAALYGLCYALATVGISMLTREAFGVANYGRTYPTISLTGNIANAAFATVVGFMYDFTGGYAATLVMFLIMLVCVAGIVVYVDANKAVEG